MSRNCRIEISPTSMGNHIYSTCICWWFLNVVSCICGYNILQKHLVLIYAFKNLFILVIMCLLILLLLYRFITFAFGIWFNLIVFCLAFSCTHSKVVLMIFDDFLRYLLSEWAY